MGRRLRPIDDRSMKSTRTFRSSEAAEERRMRGRGVRKRAAEGGGKEEKTTAAANARRIAVVGPTARARRAERADLEVRVGHLVMAVMGDGMHVGYNLVMLNGA